ncbi:hypothetical protein J132_05468 [Termitomyces sp. J132]|nr:hypothetical protein J132_05468 [Termitomyces sp. J132]
MGPTAKLPCTSSTACPSSGQNSPNHFALLKWSVKHDAHQVILAILQLPLFAQAIIGFCGVAAGIPGSWANCAQYLGTMQLHFADQANFPCIAKQKGLFDSLTTTLPVINCSATSNSVNVQAFLTFAETILQIEKKLLKWQTQDQDVNMLGPSFIHSGKWQANISPAFKLDLLAYHFDTLSLFLSQTEPDGKPKHKKIKVLPAFSKLKPGSKAVLLLLSQVNATLEAVQLANDGTFLLCANLQKHHDAVHLAAQQQLYSLNIALQTYKLISAHLNHLDKTLGPSDIEQTGGLLNDLQVLPKVLPFIFLPLICLY